MMGTNRHLPVTIHEREDFLGGLAQPGVRELPSFELDVLAAL